MKVPQHAKVISYFIIYRFLMPCLREYVYIGMLLRCQLPTRVWLVHIYQCRLSLLPCRPSVCEVLAHYFVLQCFGDEEQQSSKQACLASNVKLLSG